MRKMMRLMIKTVALSGLTQINDMPKSLVFLWLIVLLNAGLVVKNRYEYRQLTTQTAQAQKKIQILQEQKQNFDYQYNLYTNPKYISEQAQKLRLVEPKVDQSIYVDIKP
jgi:cell division protein FtsL